MLSSDKYVQKSKIFLLPLIEVKQDKFIKPLNTFLRDAIFTEHDFRLILPFERDESSEFYYYEKELLDSPCLDTDNYYETKKYQVYVYNLSKYASDYEKVVEGKYTTLSNKVKTLINIYWGTIRDKKFIPHSKVDQWLNPTKETYENMAQELGVPVSVLESVKELLNPPDIGKETFQIENRISKIRSEGGDSVESSSL